MIKNETYFLMIYTIEILIIILVVDWSIMLYEIIEKTLKSINIELKKNL